MSKTVLFTAMMMLAAGCVVKTVGSVAKAGVDVGYGAAKTSVKATGAVVGVATSAGDGDQDKSHHDDPRPFDAKQNAKLQIDAALAASAATGRNALLIYGGNWCHDSRGLAAKMQRDPLAGVIRDNYEVAFIDVGHRDRNLDQLHRFSVMEIFGTPTVLIISPAGDLLNGDTVHDWRTADSKPFDETLDYFERFAAARQ